MPLDGAEPRIPFFSAALHCVAMTALVFLRSSFGFVYLRPKSVFFVFSWAFALFTIYAWIESAVWREYRSVCIFGVAAMTLYWIHLLVAFARQWGKQDQHDRYSGTSHGLRLMRKEGMSPTSRLEWKFHVLAEPAVVLFAAAGLRFVFGVSHLSSWLF